MQIWKLDLYHNTRIFILHNTNNSFFLKIYYLSLSFFRSLLNHLQVDFLNDCPSVIWCFPKVLLGLIRHHPCSACSSSSPPIARASDLFIFIHIFHFDFDKSNNPNKFVPLRYDQIEYFRISWNAQNNYRSSFPWYAWFPCRLSSCKTQRCHEVQILASFPVKCKQTIR